MLAIEATPMADPAIPLVGQRERMREREGKREVGEKKGDVEWGIVAASLHNVSARTAGFHGRRVKLSFEKLLSAEVTICFYF